MLLFWSFLCLIISSFVPVSLGSLAGGFRWFRRGMSLIAILFITLFLSFFQSRVRINCILKITFQLILKVL